MSITTNRESKFGDILRDSTRDAVCIYIASAYVSPGACEVLSLRGLGRRVPVRMTIGRAGEDGLPSQTKDYLNILNAELSIAGGGVRVSDPPSHSKIYAVESREGRKVVWIGSSNFTEHGLADWVEANCSPRHEDDIEEVFQEAIDTWTSGIAIDEADLPAIAPRRPARTTGRVYAEDLEQQLQPEPSTAGSPGLLVTLLARDGEVQEKSGLNWWNGAGRERDPNEALIALRAEHLARAVQVFGSANRGTRFEAILHDGTKMPLVLEGNGPVVGGTRKGKQICSDGNKRLLGQWLLRKVLKVPTGTLVTRRTLEHYGRLDVGFYRIGTDPLTGRALVFVDFRA